MEFLLEEVRLCVKDKEREDELSPYYLYTKAPKTEVSLSDYCQPDDPPQKGENGDLICPTTAKGEPLYVLCRGADFMEGMTKVLQKKPKAANDELIAALNRFLKSGDFSF